MMKRLLFCLSCLLMLPASAFAQVLAQGTLTSTTVNPCVTATMSQSAAVNIQITGTYSGTITFKGFSDRAQSFVSVTATNTSGFATATTTTSTGIFTVTNTGYSQIQACMTSYSSGGANVTITRGYGAGGSGGGGSGSSVTINDPSVTTQKAAVNASGQLSITCANCSGSGASAVDEAAFTLGSDSFAPAGGFFQTTATSNPLTTGQGGLVQMTAQRAFFINLRNAAGAEAGVAAVPLQVSLANTGANGTAVTVGQATGTNLHAVLDTTSTTAVTQATGTNLHAVLDTTSTTAVTQGTAANLNATVVGTGTFAVQAASTLGAETTKVIGTVRNLGNAGAITDFAGQNATAPANSWLIGGMFNTTPTTITSGNASPLQLDNAGNLLVNIKAGAGSGGTALADQAAFTQTSTNITPAGCLYNSSYATITSGHAGVLNCDTNGRLNVVVSNANSNGSATSANSTPVVIASDQAAVAIKAASASIASGAIASGAVASGAYASGAIGSGAIASGAVASGAYASGSIGSGAIASGAVASGAYAAGAMSAQSFAVGAIPPVSGVLQHGTPQTLTTTASGAIISAVASNYLYITSCQAMTTTTTGTIVDLTDGSAGTVIGFVPVPASAATSVAGSVVVFPSPLKVTTNGNGLYGANESSTTTKISCQGWSSTVSY